MHGLSPNTQTVPWPLFYSISVKELKQAGAAPILERFGDSWWQTVQHLYPEHAWIPWEFRYLPRGSLSTPLQRRQFLSYILRQRMHADALEAWYELTAPRLAELRVLPLVKRFYRGSLYAALSDLYPEHTWLPWKFKCAPRGVWMARATRKAFFDWAARQLFASDPAGTRPPSAFNKPKPFRILCFCASCAVCCGVDCDMTQWYSVSIEQVYALGGSALLARYYHSSLKEALLDLYPSHAWDPHRFQNVQPAM